MSPGPVQTIRLSEMMADKEPLWTEIRRKYGLQDYRLNELLDWRFSDAVFGQEFDQILSMNKVRKAGWTKIINSEEMLFRLLDDLRQERIIP